MSFKIFSISIIFSEMVLGNLPSVIKTGGGQKKNNPRHCISDFIL